MWLRPQGYAAISMPDDKKKDSTQANLDGFQKELICGSVTEYDTTTCGHCNRITHIKPKMRPEDIGGLCRICMQLICPHCVGKPCDTLEEKLSRQENSYHARRSYGLEG